MGVYTDIQSLLNDQLNAVSNLPTVVWENTEETPDEDELYFEVFLFPSESQNRAVGSNAPTFESGIFHINICGERGAGWGTVYSWVDTIVNQFVKGTVLSNSATDISLKITKSYPKSPFYNDSGRYVVPVDIRYWGFNFI